MDPLLIAAAIVLTFWSAIWLARQFLPKAFDVKPFLIMWKTTRFNDAIDRLGTRLKRLWKILWTLGAAICVGGSVFIFYFLLKNMVALFIEPEEASPVSLIIPGITLSLNFNTILFFSISIAVILVFHELSHGVAARAEGIKVKSTGLLLLAIIPGAFVEPDEEDLKKAKKSSQARVYAAGSTANILTALVVLVLLTNPMAVISPLYETESTGIQVTEVIKGAPAEGALLAWDVILSVNGTPVNSSESLSRVLGGIAPNSTVQIEVIRGGLPIAINLTLGKHPSLNSSYIGITSYPYFAPKSAIAPANLPFYLFGQLNWLYLLSLNIGLINMMPITAFDGEKLIGILLRFLIKDEKKAAAVSRALGAACIGILFLNISLSFILFPSFRLG